MSTQLREYWENFRSSFWFTPTLMAASSILLALATVYLDQRLPGRWHRDTWVYGGGAEGARAVLSVIASSMITVAGVVFSITIVALSLASSQFGPRLLRNFMRDTANQVVLGTFIATFLYCLMVLRTIRGLDEQEFVPHISVTTGVLLGVAGIGVLIYFIHHVAISIQASHIVSTVGEDLRLAIDRLFPEELGQDAREIEPAGVSNLSTPSASFPNVAFPIVAFPIMANRSGYIQAINSDRLFELACKHELVMRVACRPGQFVIGGTVLATFEPSQLATDELVEIVSELFVVGRERSATQDVEFVVSQLVEVALRALSPGINDPFTAISCIDWLTAGLSHLTERVLPSERRFDSAGKLRVIADSVTFSDVADLAFNQIREAGQSHPVIAIRMLRAIEVIANRAHRPTDIQVLREHAELIWRCAWQASLKGSDRLVMERSYQTVQKRLNEGRAP